MSWVMPLWLWAFGLVGALLLVAFGMEYVHIRRLKKLFSDRILERVLPTEVRRRRVVALVAAFIGSACLIIALAGPRFGKEIKTIDAEGVDLVLVVDVSKSMDATDVAPSRLERAKREVIDLLEVVNGDRIGLVVYAGGAFPRVPLTMDYRALRTVTQELTSESVGAQGSALGAAVRMALFLLDTETSSAGKAMLILSDGEVHESEEALAAAQEASAANVAIYAMGIGQESAPIPLKTGGFLQHEGQMVLSAPRRDLLTELARRTGGAFVESGPSNTDMVGLYRDEMRTKLRTVERRSRQREQWRDGFFGPMVAGGLLLLFASWLGDGRQKALLLALLLCVSSAAEAAEGFEGDEHYRAGRFQQAADEYGERILEEPGSSTLWERLGAARYKSGDFEGAAEAYREWGRLAPNTRDNAEFNQGNSLYRAGRLEEALDAYGNLLGRNAEHPGAKHNQGLVQQDLSARRAMQPPPPPEQQQQEQQQDQQGSEEKQDQQQQQQAQDGPQNDSDFNMSPSSGDPNSQASSSSETEEEEGEAAEKSEESESSSDGERETSEAGFNEEGEDSDGSAEDQQGQGSAGGEPLGEGEISAEEAEKILDGVEEGRPRTRPPAGNEGDRPW